MCLCICKRVGNNKSKRVVNKKGEHSRYHQHCAEFMKCKTVNHGSFREEFNQLQCFPHSPLRRTTSGSNRFFRSMRISTVGKRYQWQNLNQNQEEETALRKCNPETNITFDLIYKVPLTVKLRRRHNTIKLSFPHIGQWKFINADYQAWSLVSSFYLSLSAVERALADSL